ncbi:MAG: hypothetical protein CMK74_14740 [Pseudomonadales bacterium]|jgi:hypothetical protein|nr:hypothetical protein [Pseudomonadales bacterium]|tara:strand:- start:143 stop:520 length:378 start_codon:yes stop_codon:yes gene_type:complete
MSPKKKPAEKKPVVEKKAAEPVVEAKPEPASAPAAPQPEPAPAKKELSEAAVLQFLHDEAVRVAMEFVEGVVETRRRFPETGNALARLEHFEAMGVLFNAKEQFKALIADPFALSPEQAPDGWEA